MHKGLPFTGFDPTYSSCRDIGIVARMYPDVNFVVYHAGYDGAANLGDAKPERLSLLIEKMRQEGIAFDAAGIGAEGLNDEILEALALGVPGLVNAHSAVLKDHSLESNAALHYESSDEFTEALALLAGDDALHAALGANGSSYVHASYGWNAVLDRWRDLLASVSRER